MTGDVLVTGISGQQGGAAARALRALGQSFRGLSRHPEKLERGEVVAGDFADMRSLVKACDGVQSAFLVTSWFEEGVEAEVRHGRQFIDAAKRAGVQHVVYASIASARERTGVPHFDSKGQIEDYLQHSGLQWTVLRPVWFMENFGAPSLQQAIHQGRVMLPVRPDVELQMVSLETIGQFAAEALVHPGKFSGKAIDLATDQLTLPEAMHLLGRAVGWHVRFEEFPSEQAVAAYGYDLAKMFHWLNDRGFHVDIESLHSYGLRLPTFDEHLREAPWVLQLKRAFVR